MPAWLLWRQPGAGWCGCVCIFGALPAPTPRLWCWAPSVLSAAVPMPPCGQSADGRAAIFPAFAPSRRPVRRFAGRPRRQRSVAQTEPVKSTLPHKKRKAPKKQALCQTPLHAGIPKTAWRGVYCILYRENKHCYKQTAIPFHGALQRKRAAAKMRYGERMPAQPAAPRSSFASDCPTRRAV